MLKWQVTLFVLCLEKRRDYFVTVAAAPVLVVTHALTSRSTRVANTTNIQSGHLKGNNDESCAPNALFIILGEWRIFW